jgi:hypothetical protein
MRCQDSTGCGSCSGQGLRVPLVGAFVNVTAAQCEVLAEQVVGALVGYKQKQWHRRMQPDLDREQFEGFPRRRTEDLEVHRVQ